MRQVEISPEVAALLGPEQCDRLTSADWDQSVQCWECSGWLEVGEPASVLVLVPVDTAGGMVTFAVHAHPACAASAVRDVTAAELDARRATLGPDGAADEGVDVDVVAAVFDTGRGGAYPALLISYQQDVLIEGGPERIDAVVSVLLTQGWHLASRLNDPPPAGPSGWRVRFSHAEARPEAPGLVELISPDDVVMTAAHVQPPRLWRPALMRARQVAVFHGSRYLSEWQTKGRASIKQAARAGALVGGVLPVELHGPGNTGI